jgi:DNA-binding PadR family transcriptional regulator
MLNFKQTNEYTAFLIQEGLLRYLMLDRKYAITDKGREFLALFDETNNLLTAPNDNNNMAAGDLLVQNQQQQQQEVAIHK